MTNTSQRNTLPTWDVTTPHQSEIMVRHCRAEYVVNFFRSLKMHPSIVWDRDKLKGELEEAFQNGGVRFCWYGLHSTKQLWLAIEFDELVVAVDKGFNIGYDEFGEIYAINGSRIAVDVIKTNEGIVFQNEDQLLNDEWFIKFLSVTNSFGYADKNLVSMERLGLK